MKRILFFAKFSLFLSVCFLLPSQIFAAPVVSSVSGTMSDGQSTTVAGSGFGTGPNVVLFDDFEGGTAGSAIATGAGSAKVGQWAAKSGCVTYSTATAVSGTKAFRADQSCGWLNYAEISLPTNTTQIFYSWYKYIATDQNWPGEGTTDGVNWKQIWTMRNDSGDNDIVTPALQDAGTNWVYFGNNARNIAGSAGNRWMSASDVQHYKGQWHRNWTYMQGDPGASTANGFWRYWVLRSDGVYRAAWADGSNLLQPDGWWSRTRINGYGRTTSNSYPMFDDVYLATGPNAQARVEIGNAPTYTASTKLAISTPTSWSANSITFTFRRGDLSTGTQYLYVFDSTGTPNPTGYPVTIGSGGGGDTTPPTSPTNLAATSPSQSSISVSWTASTDNVGVTNYIVERCQGSGCSNFSQVGTPTTSPFVDFGLTANTFYNYHVRARDATNNLSGWSNVVGATTQSATPVTTLTIDNTDAATSHSGSWSPSTNFPGYYGTDYHYSPNATGHWFEWTTSTLSPGTYEVSAYWNANPDRPTDVSYLITHSGGTATRNNINQTQNGSQWNLLGTYTFGTTGTVRVQSGGTGTEGTVADAIRFVKTNTVACNTVTTANFSQSAYNSYGAPFDAFQTATNLMNATCTGTDAHTINLTTGITGDTTRIVYTKGYWYDVVTTSWRQYTGTCTGALNGEWCQGSVSATITDANVSTASSTNPTYLVGMTCSVQGGSWKCGCRDTTCSNFSWQIQGAGL